MDGTGRGKKMPDSFSKTVPIWCYCINAVVFNTQSIPAITSDNEKKDTIENNLCLPEIIGEEERSDILTKLPSFVNILMESGLDIEHLKSKLKKPIRPFWITPESIPDQQTISLLTNPKSKKVPLKETFKKIKKKLN